MAGVTEPNDGDARMEKPFLEHLEDLRRTLIASAAWLAGGLLIAIPLAPHIIPLLKQPLTGIVEDPDTFVKVIRLGDAFSVGMQVMFWSGLLFSMPGILVSVARFVFPGLTSRERRVVTRATVASAVLFAFGVGVGYTTSLHVAILWLLRFSEWLGLRPEFIEFSDYCTFVLKLLIAFGLIFELPIIVVILGTMGIIGSDTMREKRRHVIVGLMILAMILTPPDPMTMLLMSMPLVLLYECCIWIVWLQERRRT